MLPMGDLSLSRPSPPEPHIRWPGAVLHGGPDYAELARLGLRADDLLDFSVNSNPLGPSPLALRALAAVDPSRYPDREALRLRTALADLHGVRPDEVLVGNGCVELIHLLGQVYLRPGDVALVVGPTFGEYEAAARRQGAETVVFRAAAADNFEPRSEALVALIQATRPRLLFLCNPNNPTGRALGLDELTAILAACDEALLLVDEAYIDFVDDRRPGPRSSACPERSERIGPPACPEPRPELAEWLAEGSVLESALALRGDRRVVVLRSLTKNFGLAGLRLGYAVAAPQVVEALERAQPPWSVNALAQAAGLAALGDAEHLSAGRRLAAEAKAYLVDGLGRLGLPCLPSRTNFWLVEVGDAAALRRRLLPRGILVRDCASFGLPRHIRLAARPLPECERLLEAIADLA